MRIFRPSLWASHAWMYWGREGHPDLHGLRLFPFPEHRNHMVKLGLLVEPRWRFRLERDDRAFDEGIRKLLHFLQFRGGGASHLVSAPFEEHRLPSVFERAFDFRAPGDVIFDSAPVCVLVDFG